VAPEDRVLVVGAGPVGLIMTAVLRAQGITDITVSEPVEARRRRAVAVGASRSVLPEDLVDPPMGGSAPSPYAVVFECSGRADAAERALGQLGPAGTLVFVGTGAEPVRMNHNRMIVLELEALGAFNYSAEGFRPALDALAGDDLPLDLLIEEEEIGLAGLMEAMGRLARGEIPAKVLVNPEVP
jgi:threonine dehydrogenase-like Zn-dependent dehydrogenase